ncbi:MAG: DUF2695 domain-containing protein [Tannerella sp.]|jgi:hypothetical protein|nr:DUF2695 domain-containing protein [Tannerella sp.]
MDKEARKALKKEFKEKELKAFRESLPMKETDFLPLFDFLDSELSENGCRDDFSLLEKYCKKKKLDASALEKWFKEHGGFCDCEIFANVEEQFRYLEKPATPGIQPQKVQTVQRQKLDSLTTDFGFSIKKIPSPWILTAISQGNEITYQFQIGKKSNFPVTLERDFPLDKLSDDKFLQDYWIAKTELDYDLEFSIERQRIRDFETVQITTKRWAPTFVFVYRQGITWCLFMRTETARLRNDLKELERLLTEI